MENCDFGPELALRKIAGSTGASALTIQDGLLYAAGRFDLTIYDISTPAAPRRLGFTGGIAGGRQVAVRDGVVYVTGRSYGLWIIDARDPAAPRVAGSFETVELATGLDLCGEVLFVAERVYGIEILDVRDPWHPRFLSRITTDEAQSCRCQSGLLCVGDWQAGKLTLIDVWNLTDPRILGSGALDGFGDGVFPVGNLVYCSTGHDARYSGPADDRGGRGRGMEIFDVTEPAAPRRVGGVKFRRFRRQENDYWTLRVSGAAAYCADSHNGFYRVDVSDPALPRCTGFARLPKYRPAWEKPADDLLDDCAAGLAAGNGMVYLAGLTTGLWMFPDSEARIGLEERPFLSAPAPKSLPALPGLRRLDLGGSVHRVAFAPGLLFAACSDAGLAVCRMTGETPEIMTRLSGRFVTDVKTGGDLLFSAENHNELVVRRIAPDGTLRELAKFHSYPDAPIRVSHVYGEGARVAFSGGAGHVTILDTSDPAAIRQLCRQGLPGLLYCDEMPQCDFAGMLPINWHYSGLAWFDLNAEPVRMVRTGRPVTGCQLDGIDRFGDVLLSAADSRCCCFTDPGADGKELKKVPVSGCGDRFPLGGIPTADGVLAAFADRRGGRVVTVDLSDPEHPAVLPGRSYCFPPGFSCERVEFYENRMYIPMANAGLFFEEKVSDRTDA